MLSSCKTCIISLVRERALLWGTLLFPLVLCLLFIAAFSGLNGAYADVTTRLGIVEDDHYAAAPGLSKTMDAISEENADPRIATITGFEDEDAAIEAANSNAIDAYLRVDADGTPALHVASRMNGELQPAVLEAVLDDYLHARDVQARLAAREPEAAAEGGARVALRTDAVKTRQLKVTESSPDPSVRYYFALLGMAAGMGMVFACHAVKSTQAGSTPVGGRVSLAGIARWKVLLGVLVGAWVCELVSLLLLAAFMRWVCGVDFGPRGPLVVAALAVCALAACATGSLFGTLGRLGRGSLLSALVALLSLFTGLYGTASQRLADTIEARLPLACHVNPLWQMTHAFFSLLYYDTLEPFAMSCLALLGTSVAFFVLALLRMRRIARVKL